MSETATKTNVPTCPIHGERPAIAGLADHPGYSGWGEVQTLDGSWVPCLRCGDCGRVCMVDAGAPRTETANETEETL